MTSPVSDASDRELLELAARAAGIEPFDWDSYPVLMIDDGPTYWNPLTDDGDALRLAVKLGISVVVDMQTEIVQSLLPTCYIDHVQNGGSGWFDEDAHETDKYAAARRAITRAAASIGATK